MTDLHTHILSGMDDGARNTDESLAMLSMEQRQGVSRVVLTPHFYPGKETVKQFLARREVAFSKLEQRLSELPAEEKAALPQMVLGAEVAWHPILTECDDLHQLCIGRTKNFLLELPFTPWSHQLINQIYDLIGQTGMTPVIAHLERYMKIQRREYIREIFELGVPVQISADVLCHPLTRGKALKLFARQQAHVLASDCHGVVGRAPDLSRSVQVVRNKLGDRCAQKLLCCADELAGSCG